MMIRLASSIFIAGGALGAAQWFLMRLTWPTWLALGMSAAMLIGGAVCVLRLWTQRADA